MVRLQLLWFEKQDPASLLTHILPHTHVSSLSTPAKAQLPHGLRPPAPRGLGGPAALSPTGGRGEQGKSGRFKESACGNAIKESASGLRECEEVWLVEPGRFNSAGKNNFNLRSV